VIIGKHRSKKRVQEKTPVPRKEIHEKGGRVVPGAGSSATAPINFVTGRGKSKVMWVNRDVDPGLGMEKNGKVFGRNRNTAA